MAPSQTRYANSPEALVVGLARTGDALAFEELVLRRQAWIRNLMRRCCGDVTLADDLAQQVFLQAWRDIAKLREPRKFGGWLKRLAINVWYQHLRKKHPPTQNDSFDDQPQHEEIAAAPELDIDLDQALATLSPPVRTCVVLAYHEGMSHAEIAATTKLPAGTVKSHIRRGSLQLKRLLSAYADDSIGDKT